MFLDILKFSLKNAFRKKGVSFLAILGVAVGIALMVFILSSSAGINKIFQQSFTKASSKIFISRSNTNPLGLGAGGDDALLPKDYLNKIEKIENVKAVMPRINIIFTKTEPKMPGAFLTVVGIDKEKDKIGQGPTNFIVEGRVFEKKNEIIVGKTFLESFSMRKGDQELKIGDSIKAIVPPKKFGEKPKEIYFKIVGKFETGDFIEDFYVFSSEETVREIDNIPKDKVSSIIVKVNSIENVEKVEKEIKNIFENSDPPIQTFLNKDVFSNLQKNLQTFTQFRLAISIVAGIAGGMCILIVMLISVIERKKEFAILKAIGWSNFNIVISVIIESLFLSLLGVSFGIFLGKIGISLSGFYLPVFKEILIVNLRILFLILGFGIVLGILGGLYPAIKASRVMPIEILRGN